MCPTEKEFVPDSGCILTVLEPATARTLDTVFWDSLTRCRWSVTTQYCPGQIVVVGDRIYTYV
jgi:hypothetical protein